VDVGAYVFTATPMLAWANSLWLVGLGIGGVAYLLGSIPTGFLVAKASGVDIRTMGSGNIGATNVFRIVGKSAGIFVLVFDGLKGYAACAWLPDAVLRYLGSTLSSQPSTLNIDDVFHIIGGVCAILGHNYTCWLKFKGGKGIATSAGVLAALVPMALVIILAIWIIVFAVSRYVSMASIAASVALPFAAFFTGNSATIVAVTAAMAALAVYKHRGNIQRLLNGTESRFGRKPREQHS
jgi:glycerol-3-phosphate acyltransferase PlsY